MFKFDILHRTYLDFIKSTGSRQTKPAELPVAPAAEFPSLPEIPPAPTGSPPAPPAPTRSPPPSLPAAIPATGTKDDDDDDDGDLFYDADDFDGPTIETSTAGSPPSIIFDSGASQISKKKLEPPVPATNAGGLLAASSTVCDQETRISEVRNVSISDQLSRLRVISQLEPSGKRFQKHYMRSGCK